MNSQRRYVYVRWPIVWMVTLIDTVGRAIAPLLLPRRQGTCNPRTILFLKFDAIGDAVMATAVTNAFRSRFPDSRLVMACTASGTLVFQNHTSVDEVIVYEPFWTRRDRTKRMPGADDLKCLLRLVRRLRSIRPDWCIVIREDLPCNVLAALTGASRRVGYANCGGGFLLTDVVEYPDINTEQFRINRKLVETLELPLDDFRMSMHTTAADEAYIDRLLPADVPTICIHPGAGENLRKWRAERFHHLVSRLIDGLPYHVVVVGGLEDKPAARVISGGLPSVRVSDLTGRTTVKQLASVIRRSSLLVCNDSAAGHVAAVFGVPTVVLFSGKTYRRRWSPYNEHAKVLYKQLPCAPCFHGCDNPECMDFSVEEVFDAIIALMASDNTVASKPSPEAQPSENRR